MRTILRDNYTPEIGDYHEIIVRDEANNKVWLFDCDGIYSDITAGDTGPRRSSVVDVVDTPADLDTYDKSSLVVGDTIIVMNESTGLDRVKTSIYRLNELKQFEKIDNINYQDGPAFCAEDGLSFSAGTAGDPCTFMLRGVAMVGATTTTDGTMGMVPAPLVADREKYLRGDGTWQEVAAPIALVNGYLDAPTTPGSAISANGIGFEIFGRKPGVGTATVIDYKKVRMHKNANISHPDVDNYSYVVLGEATLDSTNCGSVAIGCGDIDEGGAYVEGDSAIAIGAGAWVVGDSTIAIGHNAYAVDSDNPVLYGNIAIGNNVEAKRSGTMAIGSSAVASSGDAIAFGNSTTASGSAAIAIGQNATASGSGSIAFPYGSSTTQGVMDLGVFNTSFGYNNTNYRLISNVHDPVNAQDVATKNYVDSQGGGPTVVQTTGQSTTDVMSQKGVTDTLFYNNDPKKIIITKFDSSQNPGQYSTALNGTIANGATYSFSTAGGRAYANHTINMGQYAVSSGEYSISIGAGSSTGGQRDVAIGFSAKSQYYGGSVALGANSGSNITTSGIVDVGSSNTYTGYNQNSNYRLITGVYDAQNAHDAVTLGQLNALISLINAALGTNITVTNGVITNTGGNSSQGSSTEPDPGTSAEPTITCPSCQQQTSAASQFCEHCGYDLSNGGGEEPAEPEEPVSPDEPAPEDSGEAAPEG